MFMRAENLLIIEAISINYLSLMFSLLSLKTVRNFTMETCHFYLTVFLIIVSVQSLLACVSFCLLII